MDQPTAELESKIHPLETELADLGQQLAEALAGIRQYGRLPPSDLRQRLEQVQNRFADLRGSLIALAAAEGIAPFPQPERIVFLSGLAALAQKIGEARAARQQKPYPLEQAREVLQRVLRVAHKEKPSFAPLQQCQTKATELSGKLGALPRETGPNSAKDLPATIQPFFDLLVLVEQNHALDDVHWQKLQESVTRHFGAALALAAARGNLHAPPSGGLVEAVPGVPIGAGSKAEPVKPVSPPAAHGQDPASAVSAPAQAVEDEKPGASEAPPPDDASPHAKHRIRTQLLQTIKDNLDVPSFSVTTQKLLDLTSQQGVSFRDIADVVKLDPGHTSRCLRLANSAAFGGQSITDVPVALFRLGFVEIRRLAMGVEIFNRLSNLHVDATWDQFWLHSLLTARVTECLANAYHQPDGKEYIAGLLHDVGKLFLAHYFPRPYDDVILHAAENNCSLYQAEKQLLDITHPEVGALLCEKWRLGGEIIQAIRYHHEPEVVVKKGDGEGDRLQIVTACVSAADLLANICNVNIAGGRKMESPDFESSPEWSLLMQFKPRSKLDLDVGGEIQKTYDAMEAVKNSAPEPKAPAGPSATTIVKKGAALKPA